MKYTMPPHMPLDKKILEKLSYPVITDNNFITWQVSSEINDPLALVSLTDSIERLVGRISKTKRLPYDVERSLHGTSYIRIDPAIEVDLLKIVVLLGSRKNILSTEYQLSERAELLLLVLDQLGAAKANFTGDPMNVIGADCLFEGEFINAIMSRYLEKLKSRKFMESNKQRTIAVKKDAGVVQRALRRLSQYHSAIQVQKLALGYRNSMGEAHTAHQLADHFQRFKERLFPLPDMRNLLGIVWERRYVPETGVFLKAALLWDRFHQLYDGRSDESAIRTWEQSLPDATGFSLGHYHIEPQSLADLLVEQIKFESIFRYRGTSKLANFGCELGPHMDQWRPASLIFNRDNTVFMGSY